MPALTALSIRIVCIMYFQPLEHQPLPLETGEQIDYLLELKHDFKTFMEDSVFFMKAEQKKDIVRYSDKYKDNKQATDSSISESNYRSLTE